MARIRRPRTERPRPTRPEAEPEAAEPAPWLLDPALTGLAWGLTMGGLHIPVVP